MMQSGGRTSTASNLTYEQAADELYQIEQDEADAEETAQDEADDTSVFSTGQQGSLTASGIEALFNGRTHARR